jgi:hypothetical protein
MTRRTLYAVLAAAFGLAAVSFLLWMFSSASLACTACDCTYSLFHEMPRCRQPYYAMVGAAATGIAAVACLVLALRTKTGRANNHG